MRQQEDQLNACLQNVRSEAAHDVNIKLEKMHHTILEQTDQRKESDLK